MKAQHIFARLKGYLRQIFFQWHEVLDVLARVVSKAAEFVPAGDVGGVEPDVVLG